MIPLSDTLVVPMKMIALCVGQTDVNGSSKNPYGTKDFARLSPDFTLLPYAEDNIAKNKGPYLSTQSLPATFQDASDPLDVGIHLHWILPEAIAHGAQGENAAIAFPSAPNRWLIARIATNTADPQNPATDVKAWILESDRLTTNPDPNLKQNATSLAIPIKPRPTKQPNKSWMTLGQVFDFETWAEDGAAQRAPLTAVGYGDVSYAATYQLCPNVFGFWDTMEDLDPSKFPPNSTRVSYMVTGWYSDADQDPLARIVYPSKATYEEKLAAIEAAYKWRFEGDSAKNVPGRSTYNALMTKIPWDIKTHYISKRTATPSDLQVAVGNTTPEALSALLAHQEELRDVKNIELALNALQLGLLQRLQLPNGLHDIDQAIHQAGFSSTSNGTVWIIETDPAGDKELQSNSLANVPVDIGDALNDLNTKQASFDKTTLEIDTLRSRIFSDWCRYGQIEYAVLPPENIVISPNDARAFIEDEVQALNGLLSQQSQQQTSVNQSKASLENKLPKGFSLTSTDGPRFWNPTDPVVLFMGDSVKSNDLFSGDTGLTKGKDNGVLCRLGTNLISEMSAGEFRINEKDLPQLPANSALKIEVVPLLFGEASFLDPVRAPVLAAAIAKLGGTDNPARKNFAEFVSQIKAAQAALFASKHSDKVLFSDLAPSKLSFQIWAPPWNPFMIQWQIEHYPNTLPDYPADYVTRNYTLDENEIDLVFEDSVPVDPSNARTYDGTIILNDNTVVDIREQVATFLNNYPDDPIDDDLRDLLKHMNLPAQAQALSGFNEHLLMLARIIQMEVSDPLGILQGQFFSNFTNVLVRNAVGENNTGSPLLSNSFSPLRSGGFELTRVRVIDTFGQTLEIKNPEVIRAQSMVPAKETRPLVNLPVRATQPVQLNFNWVSANDDAIEMNSHPVTSPVFGWVLFNHLDQSLMIYSMAGFPLGSFNLLGPFWRGAPGNNETYNQPIEHVFADQNVHLKNFALGFASAADPRAYLESFLKTIDRSLAFVSPGGSPAADSLSVLIGRPLALTRTALNLTAYGYPAMDQSKAAFKAAIDSGKPVDRDTGNAANIEYPVRLGELSKTSDGLVGYYIDNGEEGAYQTFYSPAAGPQPEHGVVRPSFDQITLSTAQKERTYISILLDPNAAIHATMGIVPMKELRIPPSLIADDLAEIAVTFLTTPVINAGDGAMPVPQESGYNWQWVTQTAGAHDWTFSPIDQSTETSLQQQIVQEGWLMLQHQALSTRKTRMQK